MQAAPVDRTSAFIYYYLNILGSLNVGIFLDPVGISICSCIIVRGESPALVLITAIELIVYFAKFLVLSI